MSGYVQQISANKNFNYDIFIPQRNRTVSRKRKANARGEIMSLLYTNLTDRKLSNFLSINKTIMRLTMYESSLSGAICLSKNTIFYCGHIVSIFGYF